METTCDPTEEKYVSKEANKNIKNANKSKFNVGFYYKK
jgi:hypothetical protein